eukprot:3989357-Amphidinium_carterae.2
MMGVYPVACLYRSGEELPKTLGDVPKGLVGTCVCCHKGCTRSPVCIGVGRSTHRPLGTFPRVL